MTTDDPPLGLRVPLVPGMTHKSAETRAAQIVREFQPELLDSPQPFPAHAFFEFHLFEKYQLSTGVGELQYGVEGATTSDGQVVITEDVYDGLLRDEKRARFTAIHEGVHGIIHFPVIKDLACQMTGDSGPRLFRKNQVPAYLNPEWQASRVAGAILMPFAALKLLSETRVLSAWIVSQVFNTSLAAADVRLKQLHQMGWL